MNGENPSAWRPEYKKRLAFIEGRLDLFQTKILRISPENGVDIASELLVSSRDPGSGNALLPVLKELAAHSDLGITVVTDGRAKEIIENSFSSSDITPESTVLDADTVIGHPNAILMDRSTEMGIDMFVTSTYPEIPKILVEDYYSNTIEYLTELQTRNLPFPVKICVIDDVARQIILKHFPDLEGVIDVTGQPAFDKFFHEDTEEIARKTKEMLGIKKEEKLVVYMSSIDEPEKIKLMAESLKNVSGDFYFVFRRHPRDNVSYDTYKRSLVEAGIKVVDTDHFSTNEIGAAADVVLTTWSTEGLHGIYRRKPTAHIIDHNFNVPKEHEFPLPPVKLGASAGISDVGQVGSTLSQLLDLNSDVVKEMMNKMSSHYPADGKNAQRVAEIVKKYL